MGWANIIKCFKCGGTSHTVDLAQPSYLFDPKALNRLQTGVKIPQGKFDSIGYEKCESKMNKDEEVIKGYSFLATSNFRRYLLFILIGIITGIVGSLLNIICALFRCTLNAYLQELLLYQTAYISFPIIMLAPCIFAVIGSVIVVYIEPSASGGGVAQVLAYVNGVKIPRVLDFRVLFVKFISTSCMHISGLPGGKEGPMIHMGSIIGSSVPLMRNPIKHSRIFPYFAQENERREFIIAGAAAGLTAAFGTPLGGFLLAVEEYVSFWKGDLYIRIFLCCLASATVFNFLNSWYKLENGVFSRYTNLFLESFSYPGSYEFNILETPFYVFFGLCGGMLGAFWMKIHKLWQLVRKKWSTKKPIRVLEVFVIALIMNAVNLILLLILNYCSPYPRSHYSKEEVGLYCPKKDLSYSLKFGCLENASVDVDQFSSQAIFSLSSPDKVFDSMFDPNLDFVSIVSVSINWILYYVLSAIHTGSAISAGLFIPNIVSGAMFGRLVGIFLMQYFDYAGTWAPVAKCAFYGTAALLTGVTRLTFTVAVIMCEGSTNFILLFPITMVAVWSRIIGDIFNQGIYEMQMKKAGYPIISRYPPPLAINKSAEDVMAKQEIVTLTPVTTVGRLFEVAFETKHNGFPVVSRSNTEGGVKTKYGKLVGLILRSEILIILKNKWFDSPTRAEEIKHRVSAFRRDFAELIAKEAIGTPAINMNETVDLKYIMDETPFTVKPEVSLNRTYRLFSTMGLRHLIVVDGDNQVVGMITRKDLASFKTHLTLRGMMAERFAQAD